MTNFDGSATGARSGTLVLAWGNPGRQDDGLGPAFAEGIGQLALENVSVVTEYQLQVENAEKAARYRRVFFVDAARGGETPFSVRRICPAAGGIRYSSHSVSPESILSLSRDLFDAEPEAWLIGIRGYEFDDFGEVLSEQARSNLSAALGFIKEAIQNNTLCERRPEPAASLEPQDRGGAP